MSKTFTNITGAELLRADSYSQKIHITDVDGHTTNLINEEQFWSTKDQSKRLYFDYKDSSNQGWAIEQDGWNDYTQDRSRQLSASQTEKWINSKVFCDNISTLTIIQGYAGCGKTVFINSFLQQRNSIQYNDIYVDYDSNASESGYLPSSIRNHTITQLTNCLLQDDGLKIYNKFVYLLSKYYGSSATFSNILAQFRENGQISTLAKQIFDSRNDAQKVSELKADFRIQFISGSLAISGGLKGSILSNINVNIENLSLIEEKYIKTLLENYLTIDLILLYSIHLIRKQDTEIIFYDNLDIIDNPQHILFFINKLQEVLHKISLCYNNNDPAPIFNIIIAVRKITYAVISSFVEVREPERGFDDIKANFLDISNLYSSIQLLKYKAEILLNNFQDYIPDKYDRVDVQNFLKALIQIPEITLKEICLPDLFNHNIRACANILEQAMNYSSQIIPKKANIKKMSEKCSSAIWVHNICAVLHEKKIWRNLGYNTNDKTKIQFPTTLSRLILTYLYNYRRGFRDNIEGFESTEVSFKKIVEEFELLPFSSFPPGYTYKSMSQITKANYTKKNTQNRIISTMSKMLKRNMETDGINPKDEMELWRRPLYFTKNAFPLLDQSGENNVEKELARQIKVFDKENATITEFCITDEGFTFIEKIATNFEFYSIRYNGNTAIPLCYLTNAKEIDDRVNRVFVQVKNCIDKHQWFMDFYIQKYGKSNNDLSSQDYKDDVDSYLSQLFHPRTDKNKPQLHIVRTIYDHIYYLNDYRDYLIEINHENLNELNKCLLRWIGMYLELYRKNLYNLLDNTIGSYNEVFLDLKYLYWRIYSDPTHLPYDDSGTKRISISRNAFNRKHGSIQIPDEELRSQPMLIE